MAAAILVQIGKAWEVGVPVRQGILRIEERLRASIPGEERLLEVVG
jgi:hypothetical protein